MLSLMSDITTKITSHNAMPCWVELLVKLLLNVCSNVYFNVELLQSLHCTFNCVCLHVFRYIRVLNDRFSFRLIGLFLVLDPSKKDFLKKCFLLLLLLLLLLPQRNAAVSGKPCLYICGEHSIILNWDKVWLTDKKTGCNAWHV